MIERYISSHSGLYTTIKLDETNSLGLLKIRIRSLIHTLEQDQDKQPSSPSEPVSRPEARGFITLKNIPLHKKLVYINYTHIFGFYPYYLRRLGYDVTILDDHPEYDHSLVKYGGNMCPMTIFQAKVIIHAIQKLGISPADVVFVLLTIDGPCNVCEQGGAIMKTVYNCCGQYINYTIADNNVFQGTYIICSEFLMNTYLTHQLCADPDQAQQLYDKWSRLINQTEIYNPIPIISQMVADFQKMTIVKDPSVFPKIGIVGVSRYFDSLSYQTVINYLKSSHLLYMNPLVLLLSNYYRNNPHESLLDIYGGTFGKLLHSYFWWCESYGVDMFVEKMVQSLPIPDGSPLFYKPKIIDLISQIVPPQESTPQIRVYLADILYLLENGINHIIMIDSLNCASSLVGCTGLIIKIKQYYPKLHFFSVGYDPSMSLVNLQNRLQLFADAAKEEVDEVDEDNNCLTVKCVNCSGCKSVDW
jgi:hypothetical protein